MEYTNSSLVSYTRISKNSNPRTGKICRLSPHVMAGNLSVETCGNVFANGSASSNYGIGTDGRIALYVEEKNRSWCTSSKNNDHQAVTIEVANNSRASNWPVSDKAFSSLVNLSVDICRRNGKTKLLWLGSKEKALAYKPADDEMVITTHRWFANKACCGDYLYAKLGELAQMVTAALSTTTENTNKDEIEETPQVTAQTDEAYLWNKLGTVITNDFGKAGMMGNLFAESGLQSINLQNSYESKLGHTDTSYTAAVDNGSYTNFVRDSAGYGLAQWTYWTRKEGLLNFAKSKSKSIGDFRDVQVEYLLHELRTSFKNMVTKLNACTSVKQASDIVLTEFEKPADQGDRVKTTRANYSTHFYNMYAAKYKIPYTVRVTCDTLNIRAGAGTDTAKTGKTICDRGIYTIIEEKPGKGANLWGKLKSGAGWISLDYTEKT